MGESDLGFESGGNQGLYIGVRSKIKGNSATLVRWKLVEILWNCENYERTEKKKNGEIIFFMEKKEEMQCEIYCEFATVCSIVSDFF